MTQHAIRHVIASAVVAAGTFTVAYPTGTQKNTFVRGFRHQIVALGATFNSPADFTVSFGAADVTVTWGSSAPTLPANTEIWVGFDVAGAFNQYLTPRKSVVRPLSLIEVNLGSPDVADADGVSVSQDVTIATTPLATITGALASGGVATMDVPRNIVAAWTGAAVLTVTGTDVNGDVIVEASASGTSLTGKKAFKTVTSCSFSANVTSATIGTADVIGLPIYVPNVANLLRELQDGVALAPTGPVKVYLQGQALEAAVDAGTGLNFVCPVAGYISKMYSIAQTGITTGGAIALEVNTVAVTGLSVVVADGAAEGEVDSDVPTTARSATTVVAAGDRLEVQFAAGFNAASDLLIVIEIEATMVANGTLVAGVLSDPTAATGDVRGTYQPAVACDGALGFSLILALWDPNEAGLTNFDG